MVLPAVPPLPHGRAHLGRGEVETQLSPQGPIPGSKTFLCPAPCPLQGHKGGCSGPPDCHLHQGLVASKSGVLPLPPLALGAHSSPHSVSGALIPQPHPGETTAAFL